YPSSTPCLYTLSLHDALPISLIAAAAAVIFEQQSPMQVISMWGDGFWDLLSFTMQMLLVLVAGYMLASSPVIRRLLVRIASTARSEEHTSELQSRFDLVCRRL